MKRVQLLVLLLWASFNLYSQSLGLEWAHSLGNGVGAKDEITTTYTDEDGNVFATGYLVGHSAFNALGVREQYLTSRYAAENAFILKYDSIGNLKWAQLIACDNRAIATDIALDSKGNVVVTGYFTGELDFDPSPGRFTVASHASDETDVFLAKYNPNGRLIWGKSFGGKGNDAAASLDLNSRDEILLTGSYSDTCDFDPSSSINRKVATGRKDIFLTKFTDVGNLQWVIDMPGSSTDDQGLTVTVDAHDQVWVAGEFSGSIDADPSLASYNLLSTGNTDAFFAKYSNAGTFITARSIGGSSPDQIKSLQVSATGYIAVTGYFTGTADFDPSSGTRTLSSNGARDVFIAQYDSIGRYQWARGFGGTRIDEASDITYNRQGELFVTGYFQGTVDFDPSSSTQNITATEEDIFLCAYDSLGRLQWADAFKGTRNNHSQTVSTDVYGNVICAGSFQFAADFDPQSSNKYLYTLNQSDNTSFIGRYRSSNGQLRNVWSSRHQNGGNDGIQNIEHDSEGNLVVVGNFSVLIDMDPGPLFKTYETHRPANQTKSVVAKYDTVGRHLWSAVFQGPGTDFAGDLAIDRNDNVYVTGSFTDSIDLDPIFGQNDTVWHYAENGNAFYLVKLDPMGRHLWSKSEDGTDLINGRKLAIDSSNAILAAGSFKGSHDFDTLAIGKSIRSNSTDPFLVKYDEDGTCLLAQHFVGGSSTIYGIATGPRDNDYYIVGDFDGTVDFDPSTGTGSVSNTTKGSDIFIAAYDSLGNYEWAKSFGGNDRMHIDDLALDEDGHLYTTGYYYGTADFDPGSKSVNRTSSGEYDIFIASYTPDGIYRWANTPSSTSTKSRDRGNSIICRGGIVYTSGFFAGTVDFDPSSTQSATLSSKTENSGEFYIAMYDSGGVYISNNQLSARGQSPGLSIYEGDICVGGSYYYSGDFDPIADKEQYLHSLGGQDMFLACYRYTSPCTVKHSSISPQQCSTYVSPANNQYEYSGRYLDTIPSYSGCDSIITIWLTIEQKRSTIKESFCGSYTVPSKNATYTSSGVYFDTLKTAMGCDSILKIRLSKREVFGSLSVADCKSITSPSGKYTYSSSGMYSDTLNSALGCDSIISVNFTYLNDTMFASKISKCNSYTLPSGRRTVNSSGTYLDTLKTVDGCDSILSIQVTILGPFVSTITPKACDTYMSPSGKTYTSSGTYRDTVPAALGCDSLITINLTLHHTTTITNKVRACGSYTLPGTSTLVTQTGTYSDSLIGPYGCDSILKYEVTIENLKAAIAFNTGLNELYAVNAADTYQWLSCLTDSTYSVVLNATDSTYSPTKSGNYALAVQGVACFDTSSCESVVITSRPEVTKNTWKVYPNPSLDWIYVQLVDATTGTLEIMDLSGKTVLLTTFSGSTIKIDVSALESGMYYLKLENSSTSELKKVLKL